MTEVVLLAPLDPIVESTLHSHGIETIREWETAPAEVAQVRRRARGLTSDYTLTLDEALLDSFPKLEIVAHFGVGYDTVDVAAALARRVIVTHTPDVLTEEVADTTLGLLLCTVRELPRADRYVRAGLWPSRPYRFSDTLRDKTVGIFGLGRVGKAVARRCEAFGLSVAYCGRSRQADVAYSYFASLIELARASDILVVTAPATAETRHAVDAEVLAALGPEGTLVNVARGSLVDEAALVRALSAGTIRAAGLDVFAHEPLVPEELLAMENVVLLPHIGSASRVTRQAMARLVAANLVSWFSGNGALTPIPEMRSMSPRST